MQDYNKPGMSTVIQAADCSCSLFRQLLPWNIWLASSITFLVGAGSANQDPIFSNNKLPGTEVAPSASGMLQQSLARGLPSFSLT
jgi:hypothetical protein